MTTPNKTRSKSSKLGLESISVTTLGTDPSVLPFLEWSDHDIHQENWNEVVHIHTQKPSSSHSRIRSISRISAPAVMSDEPLRFQDHQMVNLPYSILAYQWKPAKDVFPNARLEVYVDSNEYPDLIKSSKHLLHSEFVRSFISSVHILMYLGNTTQFDVEFASANFKPTTQGIPWRPWHHIYSNSLAGTSNRHEPTVNKIGKYVVRLFWMGTWRKIYVDDRLPLHILNHVLLPSLVKTKETPKNIRKQTKANTVEIDNDEVVELWPYLLTKALLKVASLTWYGEKELIDFDIIQCLTGWSPQKISTEGLSSLDIWNICWSTTEHYAYTNEEETHPKISKSGLSSKSISKANKSEKIVEEKDECVSKDLTKEKDSNFCHLVARCNDLRDHFAEKYEVNSLAPCWAHDFLIIQTRNMPLNRPTEFEHWKRLRWLPWALRKGIITPEELNEDVMCYKIVSGFKKVKDLVVYRQPSKIPLETIALDTLTPSETKKEKEKDKKDKQSKEGKQGKQSKDQQNRKSASRDSKTTSNSSKTDDTKKTVHDNTQTFNPSTWVDYQNLSTQINTLIVYYKPSKFKCRVDVTDFIQKEAHRKDSVVKSEHKILTKPVVLQKFRNEPVYMFIDSVDSKLLIINLSQAGYTEILQPMHKVENTAPILETITECEFCLASLVKRIKANVTRAEEEEEEEVLDYIPVPKLQPVLVEHHRFYTHIVFEEYNWRHEKLGNNLLSLNTYGSKATTLELGAGRKILKLWIRSQSPYVLNIFSDTDIVVGSIDTILQCMTQESHLLQEFCINVGNNFGTLIETFATPEFSDQLKIFYNCYKPTEKLSKAECCILHDTFYEVLCRLIDHKLGTKERRALKIMFLRWQQPLRLDYPEGYNLCNCYDEADLEYLKMLEKYVITIQAFLRGAFERQLLKFLRNAHKDNEIVADSLFNIYSTLFAVDRRLTTLPNFVRTFLDHPELHEVKTKYQMYHDMDNILTLRHVELCGKTSEGTWNFLFRQHFYVNSTKYIPIKITFFCEDTYNVVRVVDCDTCTEFKRYTNNVAVNKYKSNKRGYTALCYVWSLSTRQVTYRLTFATKKDIGDDKIILSPISSKLNTFTGVYTPNATNILCQYLICLRSEYSVLSFRFSSSYSEAVIRLKLIDDQERVITNVVGKEHIIIPTFVVNYHEKPIKPMVPKVSKTSKSSRSSGGSRGPRRSSRVGSIGASAFRGSAPSASARASIIAGNINTAKLKEHSRKHINAALGQGTSFKDGVSAASVSFYEYGYQPDNDTVLFFMPITGESRKVIAVREPTVYRLEITVENDSWPLTAEEWKSVSKSDKPATEYITSRSSKKQSKVFYKQPTWIMDIIQNHDDVIEFIKDNSREKLMKEVTSVWCEKDLTRLTRGHNLRKQFIESTLIPNPDLPPVESFEMRSTDKDYFSATILPMLDLSPYMSKNPDDVHEIRKIRDDEEVKEILLKMEMSMIEAEITHKMKHEQLDNFISSQINKLDLIRTWFEGVRNESNLMMNYSTKVRSECISNMQESDRLQKLKEEEEKEKILEEQKLEEKKKVKKGKKDKKG